MQVTISSQYRSNGLTGCLRIFAWVLILIELMTCVPPAVWAAVADPNLNCDFRSTDFYTHRPKNLASVAFHDHDSNQERCLSGGVNMYAYCHNNPINNVDPLGLADKCQKFRDKLMELEDELKTLTKHKEIFEATDRTTKYELMPFLFSDLNKLFPQHLDRYRDLVKQQGQDVKNLTDITEKMLEKNEDVERAKKDLNDCENPPPPGFARKALARTLDIIKGIVTVGVGFSIVKSVSEAAPAAENISKAAGWIYIIHPSNWLYPNSGEMIYH